MLICHCSRKRWKGSSIISSIQLWVASALALLGIASAFAQSVPGQRPREAELKQDARTEVQVPSTVALTLQQAISLAIEGSWDIAAAKRELEASQGQIIQGQSRPNPELSYSLEDQQVASRTQSLQINLPIELGGKREARMSAAAISHDIAVEAVRVVSMEVRAEAISAYFDAAIAQERAALAGQAVDLAVRATDVVAKRVLAGKVSPVEETKARVAEAGVRVELAQAQREQRSAHIRLVGALGAKAPPFVEVSGNALELPTVPSVEAILRRLSETPVLRQARLEVERRKSLVEVERSKQIPDLTVSLGVKRSNELQRNQVLIGLSVPLPFFERNHGGVLEALKREERSRDELEAMSARARAEVLQARERLVASRIEVDLLQRDVLPGAERAYAAATIGFESGKFTFLEVLDAQRTYLAAKSQYLSAVGEAQRASAVLDRLIGDSATTKLSSMLKENA